MAFANDALKMIDLPHVFQEVVNFIPTTAVAGACMDNDGVRYIYMLLSATSFWRYDTWKNTFQQLANPTGTFGAGNCMRYTKMVGTQRNDIVYGSLYLLLTSGTGAPTFQKYDIANNTWATLNVTNLPATYGTGANIVFPSPETNIYDPVGYHSGVLKTITAGATANIGATSITVSALPIALLSGAILNFGTYASPILAVLTASASAGATSITVSALVAQVINGATAQWYDNMYLVGNASTAMYRFALSTATWATTSANTANPAIPVIPGAVGAGCTMRWVPGIAGYTDKMILVRGAGTNSIYSYDFVANTWATISYTPNTETFNTGAMSCSVPNPATGKADRLLIGSSNLQNSNIRILELDIARLRMDMVSTLIAYPSGALVAGARLSCITSPDGMNALYNVLGTQTAMIRDLSISAI